LEFINVLLSMGANIKITNITNQNYSIQSCDIRVKYTRNITCSTIRGNQIIAMIDEIPIFCIVASFANGVSKIEDAEELQYKESNRLHAIYDNLCNMRADICINKHTLAINGNKKLYNTNIKHYNDHRIAMAFEIMKLAIGEDMSYKHSNIIDVSFPNFYKIIDSMIL